MIFSENFSFLFSKTFKFSASSFASRVFCVNFKFTRSYRSSLFSSAVFVVFKVFSVSLLSFLKASSSRLRLAFFNCSLKTYFLGPYFFSKKPLKFVSLVVQKASCFAHFTFIKDFDSV